MTYTHHENTLISQGVNSAAIDAAKDYGISVLISTYLIKIVHKNEILEKVKSPGGSFYKYPSLINGLVAEIEGALVKAAATASKEKGSVFPKYVPSPKNLMFTAGKEEGVSMDADEVEISEPAAPQGTYPVPMATLTEIENGSAVPLVQASKMYQPVSSTSAGSRYHTVAISESVRVAARWKNKQLALRVESPEFAGIKSALATKMAFKPGYATVHSGYASAHFHCETAEQANMGLAAFLASLGEPWATPAPNVAYFAKYGK